MPQLLIWTSVGANRSQMQVYALTRDALSSLIWTLWLHTDHRCKLIVLSRGGCPKLSSLNTCGCEKITDVGAIMLSEGGCPQLSTLRFCGCQITDASLIMLSKGCPKLSSLNVCGCQQRMQVYPRCVRWLSLALVSVSLWVPNHRCKFGCVVSRRVPSAIMSLSQVLQKTYR